MRLLFIIAIFPLKLKPTHLCLMELRNLLPAGCRDTELGNKRARVDKRAELVNTDTT